MRQVNPAQPRPERPKDTGRATVNPNGSMTEFDNPFKAGDLAFDGLGARTSMDYATQNAASAYNMPKRPSLADVKKKYEVRMEFFQDFYKNVKSYKEFKSEEHFQEFLVRKSEAEMKKKEAQERTSILYQQSLEKKTQEEFKKLKESAPQKTSIKSIPKQRKQSPSMKGQEPEAARESNASRQRKSSLFGHLSTYDEFRASNKSINAYSGDLSKFLKPAHASVVSTFNTVSNPLIDYKSMQKSALQERASESNLSTPSRRQSPVPKNKNAALGFKKSKTLGASSNSAPMIKMPGMKDSPRSKNLKKEVKEAFLSSGVSLEDQLIDRELDKIPSYITKEQFKDFLVELGYLNDFKRKQV